MKISFNRPEPNFTSSSLVVDKYITLKAQFKLYFNGKSYVTLEQLLVMSRIPEREFGRFSYENSFPDQVKWLFSAWRQSDKQTSQAPRSVMTG